MPERAWLETPAGDDVLIAVPGRSLAAIEAQFGALFNGTQLLAPTEIRAWRKARRGHTAVYREGALRAPTKIAGGTEGNP